MSNRRRFFGSLFAGALAAPTWRSLSAQAPVSEEWDLRWVNQLRGEHKQVFDVGSVAEGQLRVVKNWLNAHNEVFKLRDNQVVAVVGLASKGYPANAADAMWEKYPIGERWQVRDPATNTWAKRNIFTTAAHHHASRGERFLQRDGDAPGAGRLGRGGGQGADRVVEGGVRAGVKGEA